MIDLYDDDVLLWSERQGALLRRMAAGEPVNERPDWPNIIEEVESVGRSDLRAVESLLLRALVQMLKAEAWPASPAVPGWQAEARLFRAQARRAFVPLMRQRLDVPGLYADALHALPDMVDGQAPGPLAASCRMTLDALLAEGGLRRRVRIIGAQEVSVARRVRWRGPVGWVSACVSHRVFTHHRDAAQGGLRKSLSTLHLRLKAEYALSGLPRPQHHPLKRAAVERGVL
jgi:hypothetical protein